MPPVLDINGLAAVLGYSRATIRRELAAGQLPGFKFAGRWRSPSTLVEEWMAERCRRITEPELIELPPYRSGRKAGTRRGGKTTPSACG